MQIRHHAGDRHAGDLLNHGKPWGQNCFIPAEFIDHKALDKRAFRLLQKEHGSGERCKYTSAVDIPDQQHRRADKPGQPHIDDIIRLQINFSRAARTLDDNNIILSGQLIIRLLNLRYERALHLKICGRAHISAHLAIHNHLRACVAGRFEQNGIHPDRRGDSGGLRLHSLSAAHFKTVVRNK